MSIEVRLELDGFSLAKRFIHVGENRIAYHDSGSGPPVVLLHGCPFSSFVWRNIIPALASAGHRCLAPDLLGLGDTETAPDADGLLPAQADMVIGWMDARGYVRANLSDPHKRAKTRRFLAGQVDPTNNRATLDALDSLRAFDRPTLLLWGADDPHFGSQWAHRLAEDIPGVERVDVLPGVGRLVMEDQPKRVAQILTEFLAAPDPARAGAPL